MAYILIILSDDGDNISSLGIYKSEKGLVEDLKMVILEGGEWEEWEVKKAKSFDDLDDFTDGFHWGENDVRLIHMYEIPELLVKKDIRIDFGS